jgi:niacin transporter
MKTDIRKMTYAGLLTALAIIIPINFGFLKIQIPPFTATLAAHVPLFISMLLGPWVAVAVGLGSALGFLITSPAVVASRAFMHVFVGLAGALLIKKKVPMTKVIFLTAPIHGALEALAVIPFGFTVYKILVVIGVGTILHHLVDGAIALVLIKALSKATNLNLERDTVA